MMWILSYIRYGSNIGLLFAAVACFAFMRLPQFAEQAAAITTKVDLIDNSMVKSQMVVPLFLAYILPTGVKGLLLVGMISASISTLDTYFLSWAGVFAQDVFLPLTGKKFSQKQRLKLLKWSAAGVAFFVFLFSILWKETEYIHMYFAVTGSIYTGGAGAIILGALYWKNASTAGAWAAMFTGSAGAVGGIIARQLWSGQAWWPGWLNGMAISIAASVSAIIIFILVSMLTKVKSYDMKNLLRDE
jgi:SSS family solute:Na+ symporter